MKLVNVNEMKQIEEEANLSGYPYAEMMEDAGAGIAATFDDLDALAGACRFADCRHQTEPGCAVQAAIAAGTVDPARLARWQKLRREDRINSETLAEAHARDRAFGKMTRAALRDKSRLRGD